MTDKIATFTLDETRFLSNFYPYKKGGKFDCSLQIEYDGLVFDCSECAYQAARTDDVEMKAKIAQMNPYDVVNMVKNNEVVTKSSWDEEKLAVMYELAWQKFCNNQELREKLLATGDMLLEEGNTWGDVFWGICDGIGENNLGKILMQVRANLQNM